MPILVLTPSSECRLQRLRLLGAFPDYYGSEAMMPKPWPSLFASVLDSLHETTYQTFAVTEMQAGERRRPTSSKQPALTGQVEMDEHTWNVLQKLAALPKQRYVSGRRCVSFIKQPTIRRTDQTFQGDKLARKRVFVEIDLLLHALTPSKSDEAAA